MAIHNIFISLSTATNTKTATKVFIYMGRGGDQVVSSLDLDSDASQV